MTTGFRQRRVLGASPRVRGVIPLTSAERDEKRRLLLTVHPDHQVPVVSRAVVAGWD